MRFRTKLFLAWAGLTLLLSAGLFFAVQSAVDTSFRNMALENFAATRRGLHSLELERIGRMRQGCWLMMNVPQLRALIADSSHELNADNVASLEERLNFCRELTRVGFVCVLDSKRHVIAQSHGSPWRDSGQLEQFTASSPAAAALVGWLYSGPAANDANSDSCSLWTFNDQLFEVVGVPLVFDGPDQSALVEGAMLMGVSVDDRLATDLGRSHRCEISFMAPGGDVVASSLPESQRAELAHRLSLAGVAADHAVTLGSTPFLSSIEPMVDPYSRRPAGAMVVQSSLADAEAALGVISHRHLLITLGSILAAGLASLVLSMAISRPVQDLLQGIRRVGEGDLSYAVATGRRDELGRLGGAFNNMVAQLRAREELQRQVDEARAASRAKSQFLANMSHEIRTPLNGVIGMARMLLGTTLDQRQRRYAHLVRTSADALLALINDILDFSKIEAGKLELESLDFDLRAMVEDVVDMFAQRAAGKNLELACHVAPDVPPWCRGDPGRLRQVLINLTNNALKFTEAGEVVVHVRTGGQTGAGAAPAPPMISFEVTDTGIGIPPERIDRLFKSFSQVDASTTRRFGGTGLGLAISKQLVELMGGTVGVRSQPGQGSTFWFNVPLETRTGPPAAAVVPADLDVRGMRVLAVDDNETARGILHEQLSALCLAAHTTSSGAAALDLLAKAAAEGTPFRVVLIDLIMPGMDGRTLAQTIRSRPELGRPVLLLVTAFGQDLGERELGEVGFSGCLSKPTRQSQLLDAVMGGVGRPGGRACQLSNRLDTPEAGGRPPGAARQSPLRILVAEDNEVNRIVISEVLARNGYGCDLVNNGQQAVDTLREKTYDLVLMDCQMPVMDGFEATRQIRQAEQESGNTRRLPIIAVTAGAVQGDREECLAAGMDDYVTKPIDPQQVLAVVARFEKNAAQNDLALHTGTSAETSPSAPPAAMEQPAPLAGENKPFASGAPGAPGATGATGATGANLAPDAAAQDDAPIDAPSLLARCMDDTQLLARILGKFPPAATAAVDDLRQALTASDATAAARSAHALKGSAGNISAKALHLVAADIETLSRAGNLERAAAEIARLQSELDRCLGFIPQVLSSNATP